MQQAPLMPKATAVWLVENTSLIVRADRRFLQAPPARGEGHRRWRGRGRHQGFDPIPTGSSPARRSQGRGRPRAPAEDRRAQGRACRSAKRKGAALHPGVAPPGPAERHPLAAAQPPRAQGRADHAPRRHHQDDDRGDPRPHPLELRQPAADGPGDARPLLADRSRFRGPPRRQGQAAVEPRIAATPSCRPRRRRRRRSRRRSRSCRPSRAGPRRKRRSTPILGFREAEAAQAAGRGGRRVGSAIATKKRPERSGPFSFVPGPAMLRLRPSRLPPRARRRSHPCG